MRDELIRILKDLDVVSTKHVNLKHGSRAEFYIDLKKAYGHPEALNYISDELYRRIGKDVTCIAASGYGGLPPASVITSKHNLNLSMVRESQKEHGMEGLIHGYNPGEGDKVAIIDDVMTTGGSLKTMIDAVRPTGADILGCYVVVKRGIWSNDVPLTYLMTAEELRGRT